jgi:hypothetical protein
LLAACCLLLAAACCLLPAGSILGAKSVTLMSVTLLGSLLGPFWIHLGPLWGHIGSIWVPFGCQLAPGWFHFGSQKRDTHECHASGVPFGSILDQFGLHLGPFGSIWGPFGIHLGGS